MPVEFDLDMHDNASRVHVGDRVINERHNVVFYWSAPIVVLLTWNR